jgi:hypothetical protein
LRPIFAAILTCLAVAFALSAQDDNFPRLLLTEKRLHRLKLDRQRQTERWVNFETRVRNVADSEERGFELALYSAVTNDATACQAALQWGVAHPLAYWQDALIADWCRKMPGPERDKLVQISVKADSTKPFESARNQLFFQIVRDEATSDTAREQWARLLPSIQRDPRVCLSEIYALFQFLDAADKNFRLDLRQDDARLFTTLPTIYLLAMQPGQLEKPDQKARLGGLMMVNLDPNLQSSSFVQGWAMEDPKMVREGLYVAEEFLWANPYLPGLGYYNMDLWAYDAPSGLLLTRKSWNAESCWVSIFHQQVQSFQCAPHTLDSPVTFGKLILQPLGEECLDVKPESVNSMIVSKLTPGAPVTWQSQDGKKMTSNADPSGLFLLSNAATGKFCQARKTAKSD